MKEYNERIKRTKIKNGSGKTTEEKLYINNIDIPKC